MLKEWPLHLKNASQPTIPEQYPPRQAFHQKRKFWTPCLKN